MCGKLTNVHRTLRIELISQKALYTYLLLLFHLILPHAMKHGLYYPTFTDEEAEAQGGCIAI